MKKQTMAKSIFWFLTAVLLAGCSSSIMHKVEPISLEDQTDKALVTFMRPTYFGGAIQFGLWDGTDFIGVLEAGSYVQYLAKPGEHVFLARAENWSYVKADLEGGRQYFVLGKVFPGFWKARVALDPVKKGDKDAENLDSWLKKLTPMAVIPEKFDGYYAPRVDQVREAVTEVENGKVKYGVLAREDGR